ncbi:MAG: 1-acyl-sn-glycerol-3-phosphate acyltransferase [Clostridia bacterium]|nr:1-acyl-sn-glycerol-3-phosphate acyltransferase [Clostridia bacterium]
MNRTVRMIFGHGNWWRFLPAYVKLAYYAARTDAYPEQVKYDHASYMMQRAILAGKVDLEVTGLENLPRQDGFLLYANHQGLFDVVAIVGTCPRAFGAVLKKELFKVPLVRELALASHSLPLDRGSVRQSVRVMRTVGEEVKKGKNILIFPEGTRSRRENEMGPFHAGSFRCAQIAKCPIVPVTFFNSWKVLDRPGSAPVDAKIHYLKPIPYEEYAGLNTHAISDLTRSRLEAELSRLRAAEDSARPSLR